MTIPAGQCYSYALNEVRERGGDLVHGRLWHPWDKVHFDHAWVERDGLAYDWQSQGSPRSIEQFYVIWKPTMTRRFTADQALAAFARHGYSPWPSPPVRQNMDDRVRALERAAAAGDPGARDQLFHARVQSGWSLIAASAELIASCHPREVAEALTPQARAGLFRTAIFATKAIGAAKTTGLNLYVERIAAYGEPDDWFPSYHETFACPRGHPNEEGHNFRAEMLRTQNYERAWTDEERATVVTDSIDRDYVESPVVLYCETCKARWMPDPYVVIFGR